MLVHLSSVVLPDPLGPMTTTVSPLATSSDTPLSTVWSPNRLTMPDIASIGARDMADGSVANEDPVFKVSPIPGESVAKDEIQRGGGEEYLERGQRPFDDLAGGHGQFPQPND